MIFVSYKSAARANDLLEKAMNFDWRKFGFRGLHNTPTGKDFFIRGQYSAAEFIYEDIDRPIKIRAFDEEGLKGIIKLLTQDFGIELIEVSRSRSSYKR